MTNWKCPKCEGGFPEPVQAHGGWNCPWCGNPLAKMFRTSDWDPMDKLMENDTDE